MEPRIQYAQTEDGVSISFWTQRAFAECNKTADEQIAVRIGLHTRRGAAESWSRRC